MLYTVVISFYHVPLLFFSFSYYTAFFSFPFSYNIQRFFSVFFSCFPTFFRLFSCSSQVHDQKLMPTGGNGAGTVENITGEVKKRGPLFRSFFVSFVFLHERAYVYAGYLVLFRFRLFFRLSVLFVITTTKKVMPTGGEGVCTVSSKSTGVILPLRFFPFFVSFSCRFCHVFISFCFRLLVFLLLSCVRVFVWMLVFFRLFFKKGDAHRRGGSWYRLKEHGSHRRRPLRQRCHPAHLLDVHQDARRAWPQEVHSGKSTWVILRSMLGWVTVGWVIC